MLIGSGPLKDPDFTALDPYRGANANMHAMRNTNESEEEWEEADDEDHCMHDITLDLNEPHSRSGKYWKSEILLKRADGGEGGPDSKRALLR